MKFLLGVMLGLIIGGIFWQSHYLSAKREANRCKNLSPIAILQSGGVMGESSKCIKVYQYERP